MWDEEDESRREEKRAVRGLLLWVIGCICASALVFYLLVLLRMKLRHRRW